MRTVHTIHRTPSLLRRAAVVTSLLAVTAACGGDDVADVDESAVEDAVEDVSADDVADAADAGSAQLAQTLRDNGLTSVASAVELVDFEQIVGTPEFTFFAPNDEAFQSLTADELADLLANPAEVANVLQNHAVASRVASNELTDGMEIETEAGETLTVSIEGDTVMVGGATVVTPDIEVDDGIVHVVDGLIIP